MSRRATRRLADEELMRLVASGDAGAFEVLYERHATAAYSLAYRFVGQRATAEEVTQDALLTIWRTASRYEAGRGSVRSWLLVIVRHRAIDALRQMTAHERRRTSVEALEERHDGRERTEVEVGRREDARIVRSALDALPPAQLQVVELAYFGGFSHSEIADLLDTPIGTVKGRMRLGLDKLARQLAGEEALAGDATP